jgi:hypothetical protein
MERDALAGVFPQRFAIGVDRLRQRLRPAFALAEYLERIAEIVLGRGPFERDALAGPFL